LWKAHAPAQKPVSKLRPALQFGSLALHLWFAANPKHRNPNWHLDLQMPRGAWLYRQICQECTAPMASTNPYQAEGFYDTAIAAGRHRDIVGGRWEETGRIELAILQAAGLLPHHHLLDIGAGALRLGCKAVPYLEPGHYWATDAARSLLLAGYHAELSDPTRLDPAQLIEDKNFAFPSIPNTITHAIAFAVFPHLPLSHFRQVFVNLHRFENLEIFLFTVFLAPDAAAAHLPFRQPDGVVTHLSRAPYHLLIDDITTLAHATDWRLTRHDDILPRGQILFSAHPLR
jgi:hypothetical protein